MPIVIVKDGPLAGQPVLRCINHDTLVEQHLQALDPNTSTTMQAEKEWNTLPVVLAPTRVPSPDPRIHPNRGTLDFSRGETVRCYYCRVCGYVELYDAEILSPELWKEH